MYTGHSAFIRRRRALQSVLTRLSQAVLEERRAASSSSRQLVSHCKVAPTLCVHLEVYRFLLPVLGALGIIQSKERLNGRVCSLLSLANSAVLYRSDLYLGRNFHHCNVAMAPRGLTMPTSRDGYEARLIRCRAADSPPVTLAVRFLSRNFFWVVCAGSDVFLLAVRLSILSPDVWAASQSSPSSD